VTSSLAGCEGRPRHAGGADPTLVSRLEPHVAEIDLRSGVPETPSSGLLSGPPGRSFASLVVELKRLRDDEQVKGVFVRLGDARLGMSQSAEVGASLAELRQSRSLPIVCHADVYHNGTMLLAARACDEIWVSTAGDVETVGLAGQLIFGRSLLERLHVEVDFLQVGKYKGTSEPFTRDESSPEARASLERALKGVRAAWIAGVEAGRKKSAKSLGLEDGPHDPESAKALGLIDQIGSEREARRAVITRSAVEGTAKRFGEGQEEDDGFGELVRLLSGTGTSSVPHVAVVPLSGAITTHADPSPFGSGDGIVERQLGRMLQELGEEPAVKAVVLRIDSPGGSALASDLLWSAVMELRDKKPVVISIGSMAASGGYYIASAGTKIVAEGTSIVGSIGVVAGKLAFHESLAEVGVTVEAVPASDDNATRALYESPLADWDDATRGKVLRMIESTYRLFLRRIATGRGREVGAIEPHAEGRIMGGEDAKKAGLVDEIGGLERAIALAIEVGGIDADIDIRVVGPPAGLLALLGVGPEGAVRQARDNEKRAALRTSPALAALTPLRPEIDAFAGTVVPLLQGEQLLAALPFALVLR
jgi:protease-4